MGTLKYHPGSLEAMRFVGAGRVQIGWAMAQPPFDPSWSNKTHLPSWEEFSAELESIAGALAEIRAATQTPPRYFFNDPTDFGNQPKGPFVALRNAAQSLVGDAFAALHAGQSDRARADLHALTQLAQFHREDLTLVSQMIRTAIAGLGLAMTWEALQAQGWSEENLAAMQKDWEEMDLADAFERGVIGERACGEALMAYMRALSPRERVDFLKSIGNAGRNSPMNRSPEDYVAQFVLMPIWGANSEADEMLFLKHHQKLLETFRLLRTGTSMAEINRQYKADADELEAVIGGRLMPARHLVSALSIPNFTRAWSTCIRNETQRRLTITIIALERFRLRNGNFPAELGALLPSFFSAVPIDPMSAKPLRYRLNPDRSFTLYSVGEDGRDDGGDANAGNATNKFGLWEGKDAVWPAAAK